MTFLYVAVLAVLGFLCFTARTCHRAEASSLNRVRDGSITSGGKMWKIQMVANGEVVFTLSGRMDTENVAATGFFCQHIRDAKWRSET